MSGSDENDRARIDARLIAQLEEQLGRALSEVAHWKHNHDNQVSRARVLIEHPDVLLERVVAYHELAMPRHRMLAFMSKELPLAVAQVGTAAAIEAAIRLGYNGKFKETFEDAWFAAFGMDMAIHDRLRSSGEFVPGRAACFAPTTSTRSPSTRISP